MTLPQNKYDYSNLINPVEALINNARKLHDITNVAINGLNITQALPGAVVTLADYQDTLDSEEHKKSLEETERIALIAKGEIEAGFPFLYTYAAIMLYSYLEGAIKQLIILFLRINDLVQIKEVENLKITFSEYLSLSDLEKYDYLFALYEKSITSGIQYGMTRLENLLSPLGLSGKVNPSLTQGIFELAQIRNSILHRGGVADKQLVSNCPWLGYSIGDTVKITRKSYESYYSSICRVAVLLIVRLEDKVGKDMSKYREPDEK